MAMEGGNYLQTHPHANPYVYSALGDHTGDHLGAVAASQHPHASAFLLPPAPAHHHHNHGAFEHPEVGQDGTFAGHPIPLPDGGISAWDPQAFSHYQLQQHQTDGFMQPDGGDKQLDASAYWSDKFPQASAFAGWGVGDPGAYRAYAQGDGMAGFYPEFDTSSPFPPLPGAHSLIPQSAYFRGTSPTQYTAGQLPQTYNATESSSDACLSSNNTTSTTEGTDGLQQGPPPPPQQAQDVTDMKPTLPPIEYYSERPQFMQPVGEPDGKEVLPREAEVQEEGIDEGEDGEDEEGLEGDGVEEDAMTQEGDAGDQKSPTSSKKESSKSY